MLRLRNRHMAIAASVLFFAMGQAFVPLLGVEADESLFGAAFLRPRTASSIYIGHANFPLMLMSYVGTLKAWVYRPILKWVHTGVWTLREPMLAAGMASIWLFYLLLRRMAGERAALMGCVLLAGDSLYLLTSCFDWGPVAFQHLLLIGGGILFLRFVQEGGNRSLGWAAFLWGLALWDKALATWMISGLAFAAVAVYWREVRSLVTVRRVAIAAGGFLLGALPLLTYNVRYHWATFHGNFQRDFSDFPGKSRALVNTLNGQAVFGYLTDEDWQTPVPHEPHGAVQSAAVRLGAMTRDPRRSLGFYAFLAAVVLLPLGTARDRRLVLFAIIAMAVAWAQMVVGAATGGSVHHTILLWPLPQVIVAVSLAGASQRLGRAGRPAAAVALGTMLLASLAVTNEYYVTMFRNGGSQSWTDAVFRLNAYLRDRASGAVYCMDWGVYDPLRYLSGGKLNLLVPDDGASKTELSSQDREAVTRMLEGSANLFVAHTQALTYFPTNEKFLQATVGSGYRRDVLTVIADSFGRPTFEVYRFVRESQ